MISTSLDVFHLGDRRVWSMWHCSSLLFWSRTQTGGLALRRCWVGWWVAASETWRENTCVPSVCWMIRSIPAPFRSVSPTPAVKHRPQTFCWWLVDACAVGFNSRCTQHPPKSTKRAAFITASLWCNGRAICLSGEDYVAFLANIGLVLSSWLLLMCCVSRAVSIPQKCCNYTGM